MHQDLSLCGFFRKLIFPSGVNFQIHVGSPENAQPNLCLALATQPSFRDETMSFFRGMIFSFILGNGSKMLAPCNFPMVAVGSHRGNHFNQPLDCILANTVREGSLLSQKIETHTYGFKQAYIRLDFC